MRINWRIGMPTRFRDVLDRLFCRVFCSRFAPIIYLLAAVPAELYVR